MTDYRFRTDRVRLKRLGPGYYRLEVYHEDDDAWLLAAYLDACDTDTAVHLAELLDADRERSHRREPVSA